jgi:hypothetical protein
MHPRLPVPVGARHVRGRLRPHKPFGQFLLDFDGEVPGAVLIGGGVGVLRGPGQPSGDADFDGILHGAPRVGGEKGLTLHSLQCEPVVDSRSRRLHAV